MSCVTLPDPAVQPCTPTHLVLLLVDWAEAGSGAFGGVRVVESGRDLVAALLQEDRGRQLVGCAVSPFDSVLLELGGRQILVRPEQGDREGVLFIWRGSGPDSLCGSSSRGTWQPGADEACPWLWRWFASHRMFCTPADRQLALCAVDRRLWFLFLCPREHHSTSRIDIRAPGAEHPETTGYLWNSDLHTQVAAGLKAGQPVLVQVWGQEQEQGQGQVTYINKKLSGPTQLDATPVLDKENPDPSIARWERFLVATRERLEVPLPSAYEPWFEGIGAFSRMWRHSGSGHPYLLKMTLGVDLAESELTTEHYLLWKARDQAGLYPPRLTRPHLLYQTQRSKKLVMQLENITPACSLFSLLHPDKDRGWSSPEGTREHSEWQAWREYSPFLPERITAGQILTWVYDLAWALLACTRAGVHHHDFHGDNVLVNLRTLRLHVIDLGFGYTTLAESLGIKARFPGTCTTLYPGNPEAKDREGRLLHELVADYLPAIWRLYNPVPSHPEAKVLWDSVRRGVGKMLRQVMGEAGTLHGGNIRWEAILVRIWAYLLQEQISFRDQLPALALAQTPTNFGRWRYWLDEPRTTLVFCSPSPRWDPEVMQSGCLFCHKLQGNVVVDGDGDDGDGDDGDGQGNCDCDGDCAKNVRQEQEVCLVDGQPWVVCRFTKFDHHHHHQHHHHHLFPISFLEPHSLTKEAVAVAARQLGGQLARLHTLGYTKGPIDLPDVVRVQTPDPCFAMINFSSCAQRATDGGTWLPMPDHLQFTLDPSTDPYQADQVFLSRFLDLLLILPPAEVV